MSKLCQKCQYFVRAPLLSSTVLILLGKEFTRAAQVVAGILFHSSIMTSRSCWILDTCCFSTFCLRMPHVLNRVQIWIHTWTLHYLLLQLHQQGSVVLAVCLGWLLFWKTAVRHILKQKMMPSLSVGVWVYCAKDPQQNRNLNVTEPFQR